MMMKIILLPSFLVVLGLTITKVESCNEAVCASIVSKCMITQSCKCDLKNCSCCKECFSCLGHLYSECCSCVEMCPKPNFTLTALSQKSHVEDLPESSNIPTLFQSLVSEPDTLERWFTLTYPIDFDTNLLKPEIKQQLTHILQSKESSSDPLHESDIITLNCSVAYMSQCMSWTKCRASCISIGGKSFRWFHDGCCECIGDKCINYGINESRCLHCPDNRDTSQLQLDYGEDDDYLNHNM